jgi:hypothetical protein
MKVGEERRLTMTELERIKREWKEFSKELDDLTRRFNFASMSCEHQYHEDMGDGMERTPVKVCKNEGHPDRKYGIFQLCGLRDCPL